MASCDEHLRPGTSNASRQLAKIPRDEARALRAKLRDAVRLYLAQRPQSMSVTAVRDILRKIATSSGHVVDHPDRMNWRERLDGLLTTTRRWVDKDTGVVRTMSPVRQRLMSVAGGAALANLEREIAIVPNLSAEQLETLRKLASMDCEPKRILPATVYRDPALPGLLSIIIPIWVRVTGRSAWPRQTFDRRPRRTIEKWVSPLHVWLEAVLGEISPTSDQVNRYLKLRENSKNKP